MAGQIHKFYTSRVCLWVSHLTTTTTKHPTNYLAKQEEKVDCQENKF